MKAINAPVFREGNWQLCGSSGWPNNSSYQNLVAWCWSKDDARYLVVINLSETPSDGQIQVPWIEGAGKTWVLTDLLSDAVYLRSGSEMLSPGLYIGLQPWRYNLFQCKLK